MPVRYLTERKIVGQVHAVDIASSEGSSGTKVANYKCTSENKRWVDGFNSEVTMKMALDLHPDGKHIKAASDTGVIFVRIEMTCDTEAPIWWPKSGPALDFRDWDDSLLVIQPGLTKVEGSWMSSHTLTVTAALKSLETIAFAFYATKPGGMQTGAIRFVTVLFAAGDLIMENTFQLEHTFLHRLLEGEDHDFEIVEPEAHP